MNTLVASVTACCSGLSAGAAGTAGAVEEGGASTASTVGLPESGKAATAAASSDAAFASSSSALCMAIGISQ